MSIQFYEGPRALTTILIQQFEPRSRHLKKMVLKNVFLHETLGDVSADMRVFFENLHFAWDILKMYLLKLMFFVDVLSDTQIVDQNRRFA